MAGTTSNRTKTVKGMGSVLSLSIDGGTTWIVIGGLKTANYTGGKNELEDTTNMGSEGGVREYVPTLITPPTCAMQGVFNDTDPGQLAVNAAFAAQTPIKMKHQFPPHDSQVTGFLRTYDAYVSEALNLDAQFDKTSTFSATLQVTGPVTDTAGA